VQKEVKEYFIDPVSKPRMTQRDKWAKRNCVEKYYRFKDEVQRLGINIEDNGSWIIFVIPMSKSWSKKKKMSMDGKPHRQKPDVDNLMKALFDSIFDDDSGIWDSRATKLWGYTGKITIRKCNECYHEIGEG